MRLNRLFEMVYILLDKDRVTARELAERFEISIRTVYRDVEILSSCGIPIYMSKGRNGGIRLLPNFVLNKTILTDQERREILSALYSLNALDDNSVQNTLSKLGLFLGEQNTGLIEIDYNDWGNIIKDSFEKSKQAILSRKIVMFDYVSAKGEFSKRSVEPYVLWFKDKTWYLRSFCLQKNEQRIFRLSRMKNMVLTDETYIPRRMEWILEKIAGDTHPTQIIMRVESHQKYRVLDEFGEEDVIQNPDGSFRVTMNFILDEWVYGFILSFGSSATVLEPQWVRKIIKKRLEKNLENYL